MTTYRPRTPSGKHSQYTVARVVVEIAAGSSLDAAARTLKVPSRTIRRWKQDLPYWGPWLEQARRELKMAPGKRFEAIAEQLVAALLEGDLPAGAVPITADDVDSTSRLLGLLADEAAARWDLPLENVLKWAACKDEALVDADPSATTELAREHLRLTIAVLKLVSARDTDEVPESLDSQIIHRLLGSAAMDEFDAAIDRSGGSGECHIYRGSRTAIAGVARVGGYGLLAYRVASTAAATRGCERDPWCCKRQHLKEMR